MVYNYSKLDKHKITILDGFICPQKSFAHHCLHIVSVLVPRELNNRVARHGTVAAGG